jgi:hypothetical protein
MDLKSLSIEALKAKIYDSLVVVENHNQFIKILNNELQLRTVKPNEVTASEAVNETTNEETNEA